MVQSFFLYPVAGSFEVAPIERFLARQPDVLLDPLGSGVYLVCGLSEAKEVFRHHRLRDPSRFPYTILVTVKPERVHVFQEFGDDDRLRSARDFVRWMIEHHACRIEDAYGDDWTERVAKEGVDALYPPPRA